MAFHTKVFTLNSTTNDTSLMVNPDQIEMTSITRTEEGDYSVMLVQRLNTIRFNIIEDNIDMLKDALRGVDRIEIDSEYLNFSPNQPAD